MKLFCTCGGCNRKIYLNAQVKTRLELFNSYGRVLRIQCPSCQIQGQIDVNYVFAEPTYNLAVPGTLSGAVIGIIGGPLGMIVGGFGGGFLVWAVSLKDKKAVAHFNSNYV